jgi:methylmalonyl-CoA mutase N-terminal domain/subunit
MSMVTEKLSSEKEKWEGEVLNPALEKVPERCPSFSTDSGIPVERVHLPREMDYETALGFPGKYPFTRGVYPSMYRSRFWTMRQYAGFGSAEESNRRYRYLLQQGTMGLSVAFDLPTQMGYDSDYPLAEGEVGKVGVAIDSLEDMELLFDGIDVEKVTTSMTINATAAILLALYVAVAKKQGANLRRISGTIQNDILKEYVARGTQIYPPRPSMRLVTDTIKWCAENLPKWNAISISGYHIREAGATAVQELAFTLANGIAYVKAAVDAGLDVNVLGGQLSFFFNAHNDLFEEVAKYRAARRMWARMMRDRFKATNSEAMKLRFHVQTGGSTLAAQQIDNNVVRVTLQALAAVLGGCQSLHTNARDEALALPTEASAGLALRTQQIIAHESGVADTVDPLAGSYYVEDLTDEVERRAWAYLEKIEKMGGALAAIENKFYQNEIAESAYKYQRAIEEKEKIIVGVNEYQAKENGDIDLLKINAAVREQQVMRLRSLKTKRSDDKVVQCLNALRKGAKADTNLVPLILSAVEAFATVGEISDALREVWGEYKE